MKRFIASILIATCLLSGPISVFNSVPGSGSAAELCSYAQAAEVPGKITGLSMQVTSSPSVTLTWDKSDCDGYKVYRGSKAIARVEAGEADDVVTYTDEGIEPGESYTYFVRAFKIVSGKEVYGALSTAMKIVDGYTYAAAGAGADIESAGAATADSANEASTIKLTGYTGRDEKLVIPATLDGKKVTEIGDSCFSGNGWHERIYVPEGVVKIGDFGFECCSLLEKVYLPDTLRTIGNGAFSGCGNLKLVDMGSGVTEIGDGAFMTCYSMKQITLPKHLKTLGKFAFAFCQSLKDVEFAGEELEVIPERAFDGCSSLTVLSLPKSVTTIGKRAFHDCLALNDLGRYVRLKKVEDYAFEHTSFYGDMVVFDDDVEFGTGVFADNEADYYHFASFSGKETQIYIPGTATIAEGTFYGSPVNGIVMDEPTDDDPYKLIDGSLYTADGKTLLVYFPMRRNENYNFEMTEEAQQKVFHVPEGVTRIAPYAFFQCKLEQIYLPSTLTEISDNAFTRSGIAPDLGMLTDYDGNAITAETEGITFGGAVF